MIRSIAACLVLMWMCSFHCDALEKITATQFVKDPEVLVSNGSSFKIGFFSPVNSTSRYVGIWYNGTDAATPEWVANREAPLNDSSGVLKVLEDGNLAVLNGKNEVLWSSNLTDGAHNSSAALTNEGNLVLRDNANGNILWESFQEPCDTLLRTMKVSTNQATGQKSVLTSWKSASDPSVGRFSAGINPIGLPEILIWKDGLPYWRSAPWVGQVFVGIPDMESVYIDGYNIARDADGSYSLSFSYAHDTQKHNLVLDPGGQLRERYWDSDKESWEDDWYAVKGPCDLYGYCGKFGFCDNQSMPICRCLDGFEPSNSQEWNAGNWSNGCVRRTPMQCERSQNGSELGKGDGFVKLQTVKVPYLAQWSSAVEKDCRTNCLNNCSCIAYSYYSGFGCMSWTDQLIDIEKFASGGADLYVRVAYSELGKKRNKKVIISLAIILGTIAFGILLFFAWKYSARHREVKNRTRNETRFGARNETHSAASNMSPVKFQETTMFNMNTLVLATENFDQSNKLGEGGFGLVFKGTLSDGNEIAVKRLSKSSGQGLEEFMNEVKVISKLQHRNLVKLLGCCVEGDEKILVYEYMPNKSLDAYLFDEHKRKLLDWGKRFSIIEGICRGLLYLHRDSRLRIIHRDLKPSNILLDQELNPKISDFGMARIFGGNEDEANTRRVVGTYGYMSPEYAIKGQFSEKSDVFSLGIILLEIVSGKRITSYEKNGEPLSLLESAWSLWSKGDASAFIDPVASDPLFKEQAVLCIHVGLLCVQDIANDRPAVSTVTAMLNGQISDVPSPKRPGIAESMIRFEPDNVPSSQDLSSANRLTITDVEGR